MEKITIEFIDNVTLKDVVLAIEALKPNTFDKLLVFIPAISSILAIVVSLWVYFSSAFRDSFNTLIQQLQHNTNTQSQYRETLEILHKMKCNRSIEFENFNVINFENSDDFRVVFRIITQLLRLLERKRFNKKEYIQLIKEMLPNEILWVYSIYCLQTDEKGNLLHSEQNRLCKKYHILEKISLFNFFKPEDIMNMSDERFSELNNKEILDENIHREILDYLKKEFCQM